MKTTDLMNLGKPNGEQLRCALRQEVTFDTLAGQVRADAIFTDLRPELRVRRHPDGAHWFAILTMGWRHTAGKPPLALFYPLTPTELDELAKQAARAAAHIRQHNAAVPRPDFGPELEMTEEHRCHVAGQEGA